jgi:hypothetical protein
MPAVQSQAQDLETVTILAVLIAIFCVVYWRVVLRVAAIALAASAICGLILIIELVRHATP